MHRISLNVFMAHTYQYKHTAIQTSLELKISIYKYLFTYTLGRVNLLVWRKFLKNYQNIDMGHKI